MNEQNKLNGILERRNSVIYITGDCHADVQVHDWFTILHREIVQINN